MNQSKRAHLHLFCIIIALTMIIQLLFANNHAKNFGPSVDILWGIPQATSLMNGQSYISEYELEIFGKRLPIATGAYQGGLKPYIAALWMKIFGHEYGELLYFNTILSAVLICSLYFLIPASPPGRVFALLSVYILNLHFIFGSILDYGPFLLQSIWISLALGYAVKGKKYNSISFFCISALCIGLCLNEKVTAIPTACGLLICLTYSLFSSQLNKQRKLFATSICVITALIGITPYGIYFYQSGHKIIKEIAYGQETVSINFLKDLNLFVQASIATYNSGSLSLIPQWDQIINTAQSDYFLLAALYSSGGMLLFMLIKSVAKKDEYTTEKSSEPFFLIGFVLIVVLLLHGCIPGLHRPWHVFTLYPFITFTLAMLIDYVSTWSKSKYVLCILIATCIYTYSIRISKSLTLITQHTGSDIYSHALISFSKELEKLPPARIAALTYSLADPVYVLTGGTVRVDDFTWWKKEEVRSSLEKDQSITYFIYRKSTQSQDTLSIGHVPLLSESNAFKELHEVQDAHGTTFVLLQRK